MIDACIHRQSVFTDVSRNAFLAQVCRIEGDIHRQDDEVIKSDGAGWIQVAVESCCDEVDAQTA
jgi:hypothetical protein